MPNQRITTVVESIRANLRAADWSIELLEQMWRDDGVPDLPELGAAWNDIRRASVSVVAAMEAAGKHQAGKLVDALPQHESEGSV